MNANEMKNAARTATLNALMDTLIANDAVQFADASYAILQEIDGQEIWTEVTVKSKAFKPTKISPAFDPFEVAQVWQEDKERKTAEKEAERKKNEKKKA